MCLFWTEQRQPAHIGLFIWWGLDCPHGLTAKTPENDYIKTDNYKCKFSVRTPKARGKVFFSCWSFQAAQQRGSLIKIHNKSRETKGQKPQVSLWARRRERVGTTGLSLGKTEWKSGGGVTEEMCLSAIDLKNIWVVIPSPLNVKKCIWKEVMVEFKTDLDFVLSTLAIKIPEQ